MGPSENPQSSKEPPGIELAESLALDYCERVRCYGAEARNLDIDNFLERLPNEESKAEFLELVNLDLLATALAGAGLPSVEPLD